MIFRSTLSWQFHEMSPVVLITELPTPNSEGPILKALRAKDPFRIFLILVPFRAAPKHVTCSTEIRYEIFHFVPGFGAIRRPTALSRRRI